MLDRRRFFSIAGAAGAGTALAGIAHVQADFLAAVASAGARRADYSLDPDVTYLNHGSVGTVPRIVHEVHVRYLATCEENPWLYMWGGAWEEAREQTRAAAAELLGCEADEIVINRNTTDGFNLLAAGLPFEAGDEVLFSNLNHAGASVCWEHHAATRGYVVRKLDIPLDDVAAMTGEELIARHAAAITDRTRVLVVPHIDNMVGIRTPLQELAGAARARGVDYVFADGAQAAGMLPIDLHALDVDAYCMSPHKWIQSPKGTGLMFVRGALAESLRPQTVTWGQDRWAGSSRRFEDYGTRDLPSVLALGDAIAFQQKAGIETTSARRRALWEHARARVADHPRLRWRSPADWDLGASLYAIEPVGADAREIGAALWQDHGVVVRAFGPPLNTLRISPNAANTEADLDRLLAALA